MSKIKIIIPSSSANVGLGYDIWCLGLEQPQLQLTYTREKRSKEILIDAKGRYQPPSGRILGYAGKIALQSYLKELGITEGAHLLYEDNGYPVGGLGRSGAEAVGAIIAAAIIYNQKLSRTKTVVLSARGEPGEHKDNVAASVNGRFNIITKSPATGDFFVDVYDVPENLGIAIGYSSHKKTVGTTGMRDVLKGPVSVNDFVAQGGLISAATAALVTGNTDKFLELVLGDRFHEPRRANIGGYGNFSADEFRELKRQLFKNFHVALNISGAGPNMQFLYNKDRHGDGIANVILPTVAPWFKERGIEINIKSVGIAKEGAYSQILKSLS